MNNYQKAIKVRKKCENNKECPIKDNCPYFDKCFGSKILLLSPKNNFIKRIAEAIEEEDWNVK